MKTNNALTELHKMIKSFRDDFIKIAGETDEAFAYSLGYTRILMIGEMFGLMNIHNALKNDPDLLNWYKTAYARSDKIMFREYLESKGIE